MASSSPSAVDSAAAKPPAPTRPITNQGMPAISGVESTIMSLPSIRSEKPNPAAFSAPQAAITAA